MIWKIKQIGIGESRSDDRKSRVWRLQFFLIYMVIMQHWSNV